MAGVKKLVLFGGSFTEKNIVNILGAGKMHMFAVSCKSTCCKKK
jgi:hypothetical protein